MGEEVDRCSQVCCNFVKCSHVRSSSWAESCHHESWHWQKAVLRRREELPEVIWSRKETETAGQLTWATGSTCPACSWSDEADASHCTHFLSWHFLFWILWFLATWSSWYVVIGSGTVFSCKSCSCNKNKEKISSKSAERFLHYFMKHKPWKASSSKGILLHIFSLNVYYQAQNLKTTGKTRLWGSTL